MDDPVENNGDNINDNSDIEDEDSDDPEESWNNLCLRTSAPPKYSLITLDKKVLQRLKQNDPSIASIRICLHCDVDGECLFNSINWKKEDGDCIAKNTQLKKIYMYYHGRDFDEEKYIIGELGNNLPTREQLQDFFLCVYQNSSIEELSFGSIQFVDGFGGRLIEGLQGHPSLERLQISQIGFGSLGSIGCEALVKVFKQSNSKLADLRLMSCQLSDEEMEILCDGLMGNSTMKKLSLHGNKDIASAGWRALSNVIRHPNCNLLALDLHDTGIDNAGADKLGSALSRSSVKALDLSWNKSISSAGWQSLLNHLSQSLVKSLDLFINNIDDNSLALIANISSLTSLGLMAIRSVTPEGWRSFFNSLQTRGTCLVKLDVSDNFIGNVNIDALGSLLSSMDMLKELNMNDMGSHPNNDMRVSNAITSLGWQTLFNSLQDSNLNLVKLYIDDNQIDDEALQLLVLLVSSMTSLKDLRLSCNRLVTPTGWQALTGYMQSPNSALEELRLNGNKLNDDTVVTFARALAHNNTLHTLHLYQDPDEDDSDDEDDNELITDRGWDAVSTLLCNKTSIMDTYNSNHILQDLGCSPTIDLLKSLALNKNKDKVEVARQKILQTHFSSEDDTTSKMQEFLDMELQMMPAVIAWVGRQLPIGWEGKQVSGLSLLYNLMRRLPDLFDSTAQKKPGGAKRKRGI